MYTAPGKWGGENGKHGTYTGASKLTYITEWVIMKHTLQEKPYKNKSITSEECETR